MSSSIVCQQKSQCFCRYVVDDDVYIDFGGGCGSSLSSLDPFQAFGGSFGAYM